MKKSTHVTKGDVLEDLGFSRSETSALKVKAAVFESLLAEIDRRGLTQRDLVELLDEYQPNVSNLLRGRISKVSIEKLLTYADRLKMTSTIELRPSVSTRGKAVRTVEESKKRFAYA